MTISVGELAPILVPVATVFTGYLAYRAGQHTNRRQERADVVAEYERLCDDLREMIRLNNEELARLRNELKSIKAEFLEERDAWRQERIALLARIKELEKTNTRLEARLAELQAAQCEKEN